MFSTSATWAVWIRGLVVGIALALSLHGASAAQASPLDNLAQSYTGVLHSTIDARAENVPAAVRITHRQYNNVSAVVQASGLGLPVSGVMDDDGLMILTGRYADKRRKINLTLSGMARVSVSGEYMTLIVTQTGKVRGRKANQGLLLSLAADRPGALKKKGPPTQVPPHLGNDYNGKYHSSLDANFEDVDATFTHSTIPPAGQFTGTLLLNGAPISMTCQVYYAGVVLGQGHTVDPSTGQPSTFTFNGLISANGNYLVGFGLFNTIIDGKAVQDGGGMTLRLPNAPNLVE